MLIIDCEVYSNYFLFACINTDSGKVTYIEKFNDSAFDSKLLAKAMSKHTTVSFNGLSYDLPIISTVLNGKTNAQIKAFSDALIKTKAPAWRICKDHKVTIPNQWDHIDLIEVAPGQASLKIYGGRLNAQKLQDLPIEPNATITTEQAKQLREYCLNDLLTTQLLYKKLLPQITLRESMSAQYGLDLRSKSDAQIAEAVIKSELEKETGKTFKPLKLPEGYTFRYQNPKIINFETEQLKTIFDRILNTDFNLFDTGSVKMPEWLEKQKIQIGKAVYQMGIGGLHSTEKCQFVQPTPDQFLCDMDVASYYPSIILQQRLAPKSLGNPFLNVYQSIVSRRIKAKRNGDKVTAETLKICINGSFGKLGSKYSMLYAPELLLQTTMTGQLALLMLIEALELNGIQVVSANTDGIVILCDKAKEDLLSELTFDWMLSTSYDLERTNYARIASRDVNNYVAVKLDGKTKGKGVFADIGLSKNPDELIIFKAVAACVANNASIEQTIKTSTDINDFVTVRRVEGGAVWNGEYLGKAVRFYHSRLIPQSDVIAYAKNTNKVPNSQGCRPLMDYSDNFPTDIDFDYYINKANELLTAVGYVST